MAFIYYSPNHLRNSIKNIYSIVPQPGPQLSLIMSWQWNAETIFFAYFSYSYAFQDKSLKIKEPNNKNI